VRRQYIFLAIGVLAAIFAYLDTSGVLSFLPERFAWVPIAVAIANIVIQQLRYTIVDRPGDDADDTA
jgi:uncharacterized membrane protein